MLHDVLFAIWFFLPAAAANVAPIISNVIPVLNRWNTPMDSGTRFHGKELLGKHKTWRGMVSGIVFATLALWLQQLMVRHFGWAQSVTLPVHYASFPVLLLGPLFGVGALGGDAVESFFKRQRGIASGRPWFPFDQVDYILGAILISLPFVVLSLRQYVLVLTIWFGVHLLASYIGYRIGLKERPI